MRGTYCYLPILRARWGAFQAVGELSPIARSRLTPLFDVPVPTPKNGKTLETYLAERAKGIHQSWSMLSKIRAMVSFECGVAVQGDNCISDHSFSETSVLYGLQARRVAKNDQFSCDSMDFRPRVRGDIHSITLLSGEGLTSSGFTLVLSR